MNQQLGGKLTPEVMKRYANSPNWHNGRFQNLEETVMSVSLVKIPRLLYKHIFEGASRMPKQPLPVVAFDKSEFLKDREQAQFVWYGHSAILVRMSGKTILIDPMFGADSSPVGPLSIKRFSQNTLDVIDQLPSIDLVLLSHDHYDHLDFASIKRLKQKTKSFYVALGVGRHLEHWGIPSSQISEFDWWQEKTFGEIKISFTPSRHFSGRGLKDRFKSLWGGWVLDDGNERIWFSGDSGFGAHFKTIGERLGPFDFGFVECGQYNQNWHHIHMFPEETVQAAIDARVQRAMAIHWGAFTLAQHHWKEPVERFIAEAKKRNLPYLQPAPGEQFSIIAETGKAWWELLQ